MFYDRHYLAAKYIAEKELSSIVNPRIRPVYTFTHTSFISRIFQMVTMCLCIVRRRFSRLECSSDAIAFHTVNYSKSCQAPREN